MKPPYRIPATKEILATPSNGYTVLSTFSGTGGTCLGYRWAGFELLGASEFVEPARAAYRANFGENSLVVPDDIRALSSGDLVDAARSHWEDRSDEPWPGIDVLEGSPPCSAFSLSGKRAKNWNKRKAYSDTQVENVEDLFFEFVRLVADIQPKVFTAENVAGLTAGVARGFYFDIRDALAGAGYRVGAKVLDGQWVGVPQARRRLFFFGVRNDLDADPVFPKPLPYRYSISEALEDVPKAKGEERARTFNPDVRMTQVWNSLSYGESPKGSYYNLIRPNPYRPCPTILATNTHESTAGVTHFDEARKFHIPELRRLCGFPDDWILPGKYRHKAERLGRAVPPPMSKAIAECVETVLRSLEGGHDDDR